MKRYKVIQQALDVSGYGGVSVEYRALQRASIKAEYDFVPMILNDYHAGLSIPDIRFYYQKIRQERPDIVQIRGASIDGLNAVIAARLAGRAKIMLCVHGMYSDIVYYSKLKKWIAKHVIEPMSFHLSHGISFVYKEAQNRPRFRKYKKKIVQYVYNRIPDYSGYPIDAERAKFREQYKISKEATVGVFCGRISKEKGLPYLMDALNNMQEHVAGDFHLLVVGDGGYLQELKDAYKISNCRIPVHFAGSMMDVRPALAASDFFVMPSLHENHSIALLEAMAMKLPCIATDVGGNREIVHNGDFGVMVPAFDAAALESAILRMLEPGLRDQYKQRIADYDFREFSNEEVDKQLKKAYQMILRVSN